MNIKARYVIYFYYRIYRLCYFILQHTSSHFRYSLFVFVICCVIYNHQKIQKFLLYFYYIKLGSIFLWYAFENKEKFQTIPILGRFFSIHGTVGIQIREYTWPIAWKGFCDQPIFGWGQENYAYVFNKYYHPSLYYEKGEWCDRAHNVF